MFLLRCFSRSADITLIHLELELEELFQKKENKKNKKRRLNKIIKNAIKYNHK
jgi:hypothetical protein